MFLTARTAFIATTLMAARPLVSGLAASRLIVSGLAVSGLAVSGLALAVPAAQAATRSQPLAGVSAPTTAGGSRPAGRGLASPNAEDGYSAELTDVAEVSADDVWAVGDVGSYNGAAGFAEHYDGSTWQPSVLARPMPGGELKTWSTNAVAADASDDVWAVGALTATIGGQYSYQPLLEHFDGTGWTVETIPGVTTGLFDDVETTSPDDVWVLGEANDHPLAAHFDGTAWSLVAVPGGGTVVAMSIDTSGDEWALSTKGFRGNTRASVLHFDGTSWTVSTTVSGYYDSISASTATDVWIAGHGGGSKFQTQHYDGSSWSAVKTPGGPGYSFGTDLWRPPSGPVWLDRTSQHGSSLETWDGTAWRPVALPRQPRSDEGQDLGAIDGGSASDVWVVGSVTTLANPTSVTLPAAAHWDGASWTRSTVPAPGRHDDAFTAVAGSASTDLWAVGRNGQTGNVLVQHFDGTAWTGSAAPSPGGVNHDDVLASVSADSLTDAWAVGSERANVATQTALIEHWNGSAWAVSAPAALSGVGDVTLNAVDAVGPDDVWAVGESAVGPLVEHFDGSAWTIDPTPALGRASLLSVSVDSPADVWAVGAHPRGTTLALHFDGSIWTVSRTPSPAPGTSRLTAVAALSPADVWAAGSSTSRNRDLLEHFDGTAWSIVRVTRETGYGPGTASISADSSDDVWVAWASGSHGPVEEFDGTSWTPHDDQLPGQQPYSPGTIAGIVALSPTDVWTVGGYRTDRPRSPGVAFTRHWDGSDWQ